MLFGHDFSVPFLVFGIFSSFIISIVSYRLKLIDEKSELLYLSLGFYRHFLALYFKNFLSSIFLIIDLAVNRKSLHPTLHQVKFRESYNFNPALLISSYNMSTGLFAIAMENGIIIVHTIHEDFFYKFDLLNNTLNLCNINDDNIV
jgi:hypothetical protein